MAIPARAGAAYARDRTARMRGVSRMLAVCLGLVGANLAVWGWEVVVFRDHPVLLGAALLAWGLGLRHARDADHIPAILATAWRAMG